MENPPPDQGNKKKLIIALVILAVTVVGLIVALVIVGQTQIFKKKAAVEGGVATVRLNPTTKTVEVNETFTVDVLFNTAEREISAISVLLKYPFSGSEPPIMVNNDIQISSILLDDWNFAVKRVVESDGEIHIEIGGFVNAQTGYTSTGEELLATLTFNSQSEGTINVDFDVSQSKITDQAEGQDILLIPSSSGRYTAEGEIDGETPTPEPEETPTPEPEDTPTPEPEDTPTPTEAPDTITVPTSAPTPVPIQDSGVPGPTIIGLSAGVLLIIGSLLLAL